MLKIIDELGTKIRQDINKLDYPQELIDKVDNDWLTKEFSQEFEGLNGNERAHVFMILSNRKQAQTGLRDKIFQVFFDQMNRLTDEA
jgi:uncharacterized protein YdeI (YjbR/CyaY-like superfamily)